MNAQTHGINGFSLLRQGQHRNQVQVFEGSNSVTKYSQRKALIFIFIVAADRDRLMTGTECRAIQTNSAETPLVLLHM